MPYLDFLLFSFSLSLSTENCSVLGFTGVDFGDKTLERGDLDVLDEGEEFLTRFSVLISSSGHSDSNSLGDVSDSFTPDELVELLVKSDILYNKNICALASSH